MKPQWHNWNATEPKARPQILDATLAELAASPLDPTPTSRQVQDWLDLGCKLGIERFEVMTLVNSRDVHRAHQLLDLVEGNGLVVGLRESCPWPTSFLDRAQNLPSPPEVRWLPESPEVDLVPCRRLRDLGLEVSLVVPNANELDPVCLNRWLGKARRAGVNRVEITGRQGAPWRSGIQSLLQFVQGILGQSTSLAWSSDHGFGLALTQALEAWHMGVERLRCSLFGCGVQGNVPLELLLVNLDLDQPLGGEALDSLANFCRYGEEAFDLEVPNDYPVFGRDAFRTATGVHAAAIVKALASGRSELADMVYSSVSASRLGLSQVIEVGPMSGKANLVYWLDRQGLSYEAGTVDAMLNLVKGHAQVLTDLQLIDLHHSVLAQK